MQAQIENLSISEEVHIDRLYAGLLTNANLLNQKAGNSHFSSIQFGTRVSVLLIPEVLKIRSFGVFKATEEKGIQFIRNYETVFTPNKNTSIHLGLMATPTTELRPNPTTWQSQVETNAESNILGGRQGVKIKYTFSKKLSVGYGLHNHSGKAAHHLKITYKQVTIASYLEENHLFALVSWEYENGKLLMTKFKHKTSMSAIVPISTKYKIYVDLEYNDSTQELTYGDLGLRRYFPDTHLIKGFLSLGYNHDLKNVQGGLFIHI